MAWRQNSSRRSSSNNSSRWSQQEWDNWRNAQDWTPPKASRERARQERRAEEYAAELASIRQPCQEEGQGPQQLQQPVARPLAPDFERAREKKRISIRLKAALAYRQTVEEGTDMAKALDEEIRHCRVKARQGQQPSKVFEDAMAALAEAKVKLTRSECHLLLAQEHRDRALAEVTQCQDELQELRERASAGYSTCAFVGNSAQSQQAHRIAFQMASELSAMRATAQFNNQGQAIVDPSKLEAMASLVQAIAHPPAATQDQDGQSSGMPLGAPLSDSATQSAEEMTCDSEAMESFPTSESGGTCGQRMRAQGRR